MAYDLGNLVLSNIGSWLLSVLATLIAPCLPLGIEWLRTSRIDPENLILTAAVLAAGFALTAEHTLTLFSHLTFFIAGLVLGSATSTSSPITIDRWSGNLLIAVGAVHAFERFVWHVIRSRPFPEGFLLRRNRRPSGSNND